MFSLWQWMAIYFVVFVIFGVYFVLNMVIGVTINQVWGTGVGT